MRVLTASNGFEMKEHVAPAKAAELKLMVADTEPAMAMPPAGVGARSEATGSGLGPYMWPRRFLNCSYERT